jgi:hypothetical protein
VTGAPSVSAWLYERPRVRRAVMALTALWGGAVWAVATAPMAAAAGVGPLMSWTGLADSYGVPVGAYFVSVVPMAEAVREQGPQFGADPGTWGPALTSSVSTVMTYTQLSMWLTLECAVLVFVGSAAIWFVKFALSAQWLGWLAALAAPVVANVGVLVDRLWVMPIALLACCAVGGVVALTQGVGRGVGIIVGGFLVVLLAAAFLRDPVSDLVGDNGVLGIGRSLGFAVAQGAAHNGPIAGGGSAGQVAVLGAWLCDVLLRQQIQMINFGMVIDDVPGCGAVWSAAIMSGDSAGPAHAVAGCAPGALAHAQQLDIGTAGMFLAVIAVVCVVAFALIYIGFEVFRVGFKAFGHLLVIIPAAAVAVAPGPPRRFAARVAGRLVVHGVEMLAATAGLGVLLLVMSSVTRGAAAGTVGLTHPMAKLMVMLVLAVAAAFAFRYLLNGFGDKGIPGPVRVVRGAATAAYRTGAGLERVDYLARRAPGLVGQVGLGRGDSGVSAAAGEAPGRRGHPALAGAAGGDMGRGVTSRGEGAPGARVAAARVTGERAAPAVVDGAGTAGRTGSARGRDVMTQAGRSVDGRDAPGAHAASNVRSTNGSGVNSSDAPGRGRDGEIGGPKPRTERPELHDVPDPVGSAPGPPSPGGTDDDQPPGRVPHSGED